MRYLRPSEVTPEMSNWAWTVGKSLNWAIGEESEREFGGEHIIARIEIHHDATASNPVPHDHPGVSLLLAEERIEHPPVSVDVVEGIDVSYWQRGLNWKEIKSSGRDFAIIRANADPHLAMDPMFESHWNGSTDVGMIPGSYLFLRARYTGREQAEWLMKNTPVPDPGVVLPWVLDVEIADGHTPSQVIGCVAEAVQVMNDAGHRPMIYTMPGFWNALPELYALQADLWVAHWGVSKPAKVKGWDEWLLWQYASNAQVPGYPDHADVNRFRGSIETLKGL